MAAPHAPPTNNTAAPTAVTSGGTAAAAATAFQAKLLKEPTDEIVEKELLSGPVWAFGPEQEKTLEVLRKHLSSQLSVAAESIFVVGSAKTGFSLAPKEFPREFRPDSDIDVVVIDVKRFDKIWIPLIRAAYYERWSKSVSRVDDRRNLLNLQESVSFGHINPERCAFKDTVFLRRDKTLTNQSHVWFDAFRGLSRFREFSRRTVNGRLYRTRDHVVAYHSYGLELLRNRLGDRA